MELEHCSEPKFESRALEFLVWIVLELQASSLDEALFSKRRDFVAKLVLCELTRRSIVQIGLDTTEIRRLKAKETRVKATAAAPRSRRAARLPSKARAKGFPKRFTLRLFHITVKDHPY